MNERRTNNVSQTPSWQRRKLCQVTLQPWGPAESQEWTAGLGGPGHGCKCLSFNVPPCSSGNLHCTFEPMLLKYESVSNNSQAFSTTNANSSTWSDTYKHTKKQGFIFLLHIIVHDPFHKLQSPGKLRQTSFPKRKHSSFILPYNPSRHHTSSDLQFLCHPMYVSSSFPWNPVALVTLLLECHSQIKFCISIFS